MKIEEKPLVSVGIPTYNRAEGLEKTLQCIRSQTYQHLELIVSDNHSDNILVSEILKKYSALDSRIKYFVQEKNIGIIPNFQFLLDNANGDYFMWAADDDSWKNNFIETCVNGFLTDEKIVACIPDVKIIDQDGAKKDTKLTRSFMQKNLFSRSFHWTKSPGECRYFFCGMYRAEAVKDIRIQNKWGGDHMFLLEAITKGKFLYIPGKSEFYYYRGGTSESVKKVRKVFNISQKFFFFDWYIIRYSYYPFYFKHINFLQKAGLFFSNSLGLILNEEGILFRILIKKPFQGLVKKVKEIFFSKKER